MAKGMKWSDWVAITLIVVGALNWGLVALGWNLVEWVFGGFNLWAKLVYGLVGIAGVYSIYSLWKVR